MTDADTPTILTIPYEEYHEGYIQVLKLKQADQSERVVTVIEVLRFPSRHRFELWPVHVSQRLPSIFVPLTGNDPDVVLDLQALFDPCYDSGPYTRRADYRAAPFYPLEGEEAVWADTLLRDKGLRICPGSTDHFLRETMEPSIEDLIQQLTDRDTMRRAGAYRALLALGDAAIPSLCRTLESDSSARFYIILVALESPDVRFVPGLCAMLKHRDRHAKQCAAHALNKIGTVIELPRRVLYSRKMTPLQKFEALQALRHAWYDGIELRIHYGLPHPLRYCRERLEDNDAGVRKGARQVLELSQLLRAGQPMENPESELLRSASPSDAQTCQTELPRPASTCDSEAAQTPKRGLWHRLFRKGPKSKGEDAD